MSCNPRVVIHLLALECGAPLDVEPSREEKKLATRMVSLLKAFESHQLEEVEEQEMFEVDERDVDEDWNPEDEMANEEDQQHSEGGVMVPEEKRSMRQRLEEVAKDLEQKVLEKINMGVPIHDRDLKQMALSINRLSQDPVTNFVASHGWLNRFKRHIGLVSRRVTRFAQKKTFADQRKIDEAANKFVTEIKQEMSNVALNCFVNIDQSAINKETAVPRSLSFRGEKATVRVVQSSSATTHSFTIMPLLFASGKVGQTLFVQLQEPSGHLPQRGVFRTNNLHVVAGSSHIMTTATMVNFFENVFLPQMPDHCILLLDSWGGFSNHGSIQALIP
ncbi:tc5 transposase, partial [Oesophagostomum dentatum]